VSNVMTSDLIDWIKTYIHARNSHILVMSICRYLSLWYLVTRNSHILVMSICRYLSLWYLVTRNIHILVMSICRYISLWYLVTRNSHIVVMLLYLYLRCIHFTCCLFSIQSYEEFFHHFHYHFSCLCGE